MIREILTAESYVPYMVGANVTYDIDDNLTFMVLQATGKLCPLLLAL